MPGLFLYGVNLMSEDILKIVLEKVEKVENKIDIRSNFTPPAVVANPPPNKHKPRNITVI